MTHTWRENANSLGNDLELAEHDSFTVSDARITKTFKNYHYLKWCSQIMCKTNIEDIH